MFDPTRKDLIEFIKNNFNKQKNSLDEVELRDQIKIEFLSDLSILITS